MENLNVVLVGSGGYAVSYVHELAARGAQGGLTLAGVVDPYAEKGAGYETLKQMNATFYDSVEQFYAERTADLAIISTPIPLHAQQAIYCMERGSHILIEKPIAATLEDAQRMLRAQRATGRKLAVGFQWCYDPIMRAFQRDARAGLFGKPVSMRALVLWPRDMAYYRRGTGWAGKKYDKNGAPIFDCVASNATAHYLENMLWVAGQELTDVQVQTFRANPIETFDTIVLRGRVGTGRLTFVASHAIGRTEAQDPMFEYVFEKGSISFGGLGQNGAALTFRFHDGSERAYGDTSLGTGVNRMHKLWDVVEEIRGEGNGIACTGEEALLHTRAMAQVFALCPEAYAFPVDEVYDDNGQNWVPGLRERLIREYLRGGNE